MKNFDSYYDPPEDPNDRIYESLDVEFGDQILYFTENLDNCMNDAYDYVQKKFNVDFAEAYRLVQVWRSNLP